MNPDPPADIWAAWQQQRAGQPGPLAALPALLPAPEQIPPREWLYGTRLIRRFVSVLAAPGGVGKSAYALGVALAVATGRGFLGEAVHHAAPAWVLNLEDPQAETDRRVAALMRLHDIPRAAVDGRLFLHAGRTRRINMAALSPAGDIVHPDRDGLIEACRSSGAGLLVVDPFVKSHRLNENDNIHMDAAATAWAEVAEATGAAVLLVHHMRKGSVGAAPDVESARGAKSLTDAARSAFLLAPMSPEEAQALSVPPAERWRHVRLDDAKANLAPHSAAARWYRLDSVALGNATPDYPAGDMVAAIAAWQPPSPFRALTAADCNRALDIVAVGPEPGSAYSARRSGRGESRWAGRILVERFALSDADAARVIASWLRSGLLVEESYFDKQQRKQRLGVRVVDSRRPTANDHPTSGDQQEPTA